MSFVHGSMIEAMPNQKSTFMKSLNIQDEITYRTIVGNLLSISFQTALGYICLDIMFAISLHYVADQISGVANAGVGLAYTICSILLLPMGFGVNQALNCHVSQALGAEQYKLSKSYLTITFYIHLMYFVPFCLIIYVMKLPLSYTIPKADRDETIEAAWEYLPLMMISSVFAIELECFKSYLLAYEVFTPFIFIHFTTTALHFFWCWLFIEQLGMGIKGAGIAIIITEILNNIILGGYVFFSKSTRDHFSGVQISFPFLKQLGLVKSYVKSSLAIVVHVYADFFVFFLLTFVGMQLGTELFNAQIAFSNTSSFYFRLPISLSIGLLTYVGGEMGRRRYKVAQKYVHAGVGIFVILGTAIMLSLWFLRDQWAAFYAKDPATQNDLKETLPYFILGCMIMDGFQGSLSGGLKGIEKKNLVTYSTLIVYYLLGIPLILSLTLDWGFNYKLKGLWIAFGIANTCLLVLFIYSLLTVDWEKQQDIITEKIKEQTRLQEKRYSIVQDCDPVTVTDSASQ